jgi:hypothetical protein
MQPGKGADLVQGFLKPRVVLKGVLDQAVEFAMNAKQHLNVFLGILV